MPKVRPLTSLSFVKNIFGHVQHDYQQKPRRAQFQTPFSQTKYRGQSPNDAD